MPVRLQEVHPSVVHFPLALLPAAVGADLVGRAIGSERLTDIGRALMPVAAAGAAFAAATGLVAQEEVVAEGVAHDILVTHRNLNIALVTLSTALATWRWRQDAPGTGYLALALAGLGAMSYSAYLGGKMVYEHGVGVKPADGLRDGDSPELVPRRAGGIARRVAGDVERGVRHALDDLKRGNVLPALDRPSLERPAAAATAPGTSPAAEGPGSIESMP